MICAWGPISNQRGLNLVVSDPEQVIVVGAGGHAKVVIELIIASAKYRIVGLVDKGRSGATGGDSGHRDR